MLTATYDDKCFAAVDARVSCMGCLFEGELSSVCFAACRAARDAGLPDCDDQGPSRRGYIYIAADPRQLVLPTGEGDANAA